MKKTMKKILILLLLVSVTSGCSFSSSNDNDEEKIDVSDKYVTEEDKEYIIRGLDFLMEGGGIINKIIYIHKIDVSEGVYIYDATPKKHIDTPAAYEIKLSITENGKQVYAYYYYCINEDYTKWNGIDTANHETMTNPDKCYYVDENDNRLDYIDIDQNWIQENIMVNY